MAKVYDALKRVEAERSKQATAIVSMPRALAAVPPRGSVWSGWFGRRDQRSAPPRAAGADPLLAQRLENVAAAIESLKEISAVPDVTPQLEALVQQLGRVEAQVQTQVQAMEMEVTRRLAATVDPLTQRVGQLNARVGWLLVTTLLALLVALTRA